VTVLKEGVSFSSNLLLNCGARGIKFFITDEFGSEIVCLSGGHQHAVAKVREAQFQFIRSQACSDLARRVIMAKVKNQKSVLLYYKKYLTKKDDEFSQKQVAKVDEAVNKINDLIINFKSFDLNRINDWRGVVFGFEGAIATLYWQCLVTSQYFPMSFNGRIGRGATDVVNQMLNYGYGILSTYIWHCAINSGLEVYAGFLHVQRPGKPSLILDIMEEYRPWVVDRAVIKLRDHISYHGNFTKKLKELLIIEIQKTFSKTYTYNGRNISLESLMQRQIYKICGEFYGEKKYSPFIFKW
jgi:CRISPR-associated protein Cas1